MTGEASPTFRQLVSVLRTRGMPSVRNLLVTVFGDFVRPADVTVSVGSLARLFEPLGVSDRLVRTSLTRLADDDLVVASRSGNRSFYGVHPQADSMFARAEERIYRYPNRPWDGRWTVAIIDAARGTSAERATVRRQLGWLGLGSVAPNVMASPVVSADAVAAVVADAAAAGSVLVMRSETVRGTTLVNDQDLARQVVPMGELASRYDEVVTWFRPFVNPLALSTPEALVVRTLLIATYRRVVLADPVLPATLLPESWSGRAAYDMVGTVYSALAESAEIRFREVCGVGESANGQPVTGSQRFGT